MNKFITSFCALAILATLSFSSCSDQAATTDTAVNKSYSANSISAKSFCGVPPDIMVELLRNYKNQVWAKTSDTMAGKYDARFMEISIEQLENFLAYAHQCAAADSLNLTSIRMYYINYPGQKKTSQYLETNLTGNVFEDYSGCHSLALVPVVGPNAHDPARRDYYQAGGAPSDTLVKADFQAQGNLIFLPDNCEAGSTIANHNELCPPMRGCVRSTLLEAADQ